MKQGTLTLSRKRSATTHRLQLSPAGLPAGTESAADKITAPAPAPGPKRAGPKKRSKSFRTWQKKRHKRYRMKCLQFLQETWPVLFACPEPKPLALGIGEILLMFLIERQRQQGLDCDDIWIMSRRSLLRQSLGYYTHRKAYLLALAEPESCRYGPEGEVLSNVSPAHRLAAKEKLGILAQQHPESDVMSPHDAEGFK